LFRTSTKTINHIITILQQIIEHTKHDLEFDLTNYIINTCNYSTSYYHHIKNVLICPSWGDNILDLDEDDIYNSNLSIKSINNVDINMFLFIFLKVNYSINRKGPITERVKLSFIYKDFIKKLNINEINSFIHDLIYSCNFLYIIDKYELSLMDCKQHLDLRVKNNIYSSKSKSRFKIIYDAFNKIYSIVEKNKQNTIDVPDDHAISNESKNCKITVSSNEIDIDNNLDKWKKYILSMIDYLNQSDKNITFEIENLNIVLEKK